jgi:colicin import membrane protein
MNKFAFFLAAGLALPAAAQNQQAEEAAERARIASERTRIEAEFEQANKACYQKFAVNDCIADARAKRREVLADLRRQELVLNDADRRRRSSERLEEIEKKTADRRAAQASAPAPAASAASTPASARAASTPASAPRAARAPREPEQARQVDPGANARRYNERLEDAAQHKAEVQRRAAEAKKDVRPLPVPP